MKIMIIRYILNRLTEPSTIRGIVLSVASVAGLTLSNDQTNSTVWIVLGIIGLIGSFLPDKIETDQMKKEKVIKQAEEVIQVIQEKENKIPTPDYNDSSEERGWGDR